MRAWTNQLSNVSHLLILPVFLIFVVFAVAITHPQASQTQPIQPQHMSAASAHEPAVDTQQAYIIPDIAADYAGNTPSGLASTAPSPDLSNNAQKTYSTTAAKKSSANSTPASQVATASSAQSSSGASSSKLDVFMSTMASSLKLQSSN